MIIGTALLKHHRSLNDIVLQLKYISFLNAFNTSEMDGEEQVKLHLK